ncbi:MAG TPA: rhodanese-like domain-containing protein [Acidisarcina sp.]|nr:rhodanese-like domain-containing protein [Acidisarcina sp.]
MLPYEIDAPALKTLLTDGNAHPRTEGDAPGLVLLDVREPWEYATARIEGSILMPMGEVPSRAFQEIDPESHIVTICHAGVRSMNVAVWLRNQGFEQTQSLQGGIDAWSRLVDPKVPRY